MIIPVILSGGSGTRLWPLSRKNHPKQFINLVNDTTLFQDTILRLPENFFDPIIVCNEEHRFIAAEQLREINKNTKGIILEPEGKNTAPAIALAALKSIEDGKDPILLVLSADHVIKNVKAFHESITVASQLAKNDKLITFGVVPDKAVTGYGYIEAEINNASNYYSIKSYTEKPNQKNAKKYLDSGNYLWNSGMFMFKASAYLRELKKFEPEILSICKKSLMTENRDLDFIRIENSVFKQCLNKSIDYAIMEHTKNSVVVPLDANWSDVGSWLSLLDVKAKDKNNNVSEGDVVLEDVKNTYTYSSNRLVSVAGVSDLVIIDTQDTVLITHKQHTHLIKNIINRLQNHNRSEVEQHRKVFRPWGHYDTLDSGIGFQVKRIMVSPGAKLSLQKHKYRAEHWVVVKGIALVTCGERVFELVENQSTYIPQGSLHRLENHQDTPLEIIEIQTGNYLGEDDIIRLKDDYQRN
ncbi:mannose-1-phosphate guanylyltransferase/mannose-6-phosphate isomerase [Candidatus Pseudothioglobus singularis]|nr:mannose-1-phosphate guanylyltransferase/mannose-6-phosphate isomerase [Candidatus Pseudothioglobus singularis]